MHIVGTLCNQIVCHYKILIMLNRQPLDMGIGPLQLAVTWYKIRHAGEQATHWDIQNKENANLS